MLYNSADGSRRRLNAHTKLWTDGDNPDKIKKRENLIPLDLQHFAYKSGELRRLKYGNNWQSASLKEAIRKFAKNAKPDKRGRGKTYYTSADGKISVVYDREGDYFRILNNIAMDNHENRPYLDLNGNIVMTDEYEKLTHFLNSDKRGKLRGK